MTDVIRVSDITTLIQGYQQVDPRLYDILNGLVNSVDDLQTKVFPIIDRVTTIVTEPIPDTPTGFAYSTTGRNLILTWNSAANARTYEVRRGTNWDTASQITITGITEARLDPIIVGTTRYLLKSINGAGVPSSGFAYVDVVIPPIGAITINGRVIDNNVLLSWSEPVSTWDIDYYTISRGGIIVGTQHGTFIAVFESAGGTYTYSVFPTDMAGNIGPSSSVSLVVAQPPDFELLDYRKSILSGLKVNALPYGSPEVGWVNDEFNGWDAGLISAQNWTWIGNNTGKILVCIDGTKTWTTHFTSQGWNKIKDQLDNFYPIYIQPTLLTGKYQEIIDYGTTLFATIFNMNYTIDQIVTTVTATPGVEGSLDQVTWTPIVHAKSVFLQQFRYVRATIDFTSNNDKALALFYNLTYSVDVKRELDSGGVTALATDANGTQVLFNKPFKDIDSITVTGTKAIEPLTIIYDFQDVPNPTGFKVYVFNSIGVRTTAAVSWKARGIV
jgi:hypothetical protein